MGMSSAGRCQCNEGRDGGTHDVDLKRKKKEKGREDKQFLGEAGEV
jgi:hypothetical protein